MTRQPEFVDDVAAEPDERHGDVLDLGASARHGAVLRVGGVVGAAAVLVAAVVTVVPRDTVVRGTGSSVRSTPEVQAAAPFGAAATVRALAGSPVALQDYVRQTAAAGTCPTVPVGASPTREVSRQVRTALPGFTVTDLASSLDEFGELCSVRLRARNTRGAVLAVVVSAPDAGFVPAGPAQLRTGTDTSVDGTATAWVSALTASRWTVVIGAVGAPAALPSSAALQRLVERGGLTW